MATSFCGRALWVACAIWMLLQMCNGTTTDTASTTTPPPSTTPYVPGLGDRCTDECAQPPTEVCVNNTCQCAPNLVNTTDRYCVTHPGEVGDFRFSNVRNLSLTLQWSAPTTPGVIQEYRIFVMEGGQCVHGIFLSCSDTGPKSFNSSSSPCLPLNSFSSPDCHASNFTFNDSLFKPDTNYTYIISANNQLFFGVNTSLEVKTPILPALQPGVPNANAVDSNSLLVQWQQPRERTGPTQYTLDVYEAVDRLSTKMKIIKSVVVEGFDTTTCNVSGLLSSWEYSFTVTAKTEAGDSRPSNMSLTVRTLPSVPDEVTSLKVRALETPLMGVELTWECPDERKRNGLILSYTVHAKGQVLHVQKYGIYSPEDPCVETKSIVFPIVSVNYTFTVFANAEFEGKMSTVNFKPDPSRMMYALPANVITHPKVYSSETVIAVSIVGTIVIVALVGAIIFIVQKRRKSFRSARVTYAEKSGLPNRSSYGSSLNTNKHPDIY